LISSGFTTWKGAIPSGSSYKIILKSKKTAEEIFIEERI